MAAIDPDGIATGTQRGTGAMGGFGVPITGLKHVELPFLTQLVDNNDTHTPDTGNFDLAIARVAWEAETTDDEVAVTVTAATATAAAFVTFNAAADNLNGILHMWITN